MTQEVIASKNYCMHFEIKQNKNTNSESINQIKRRVLIHM